MAAYHHSLNVCCCLSGISQTSYSFPKPLFSKILLMSSERCSHTAGHTIRDPERECLLGNSNLLWFFQWMKRKLHLSTNLLKKTPKPNKTKPPKRACQHTCLFNLSSCKETKAQSSALLFSWLIFRQGQGNQIEEHILQIKDYPMSLYCNSKITLNLIIPNQYIKDYI